MKQQDATPKPKFQRKYEMVEELLQISEGNPHEDGKEFFSTNLPAMEEDLEIPSNLVRKNLDSIPSVSEQEVVRHFTRLSQLNFSIDEGFYPLGSCTMKYNPKVNEKVAANSDFSDLHPLVEEKLAQGALQVMFELQEALKGITGMKACSLHPAAGAQGELVGVKMIAAYHEDRGDEKRKVILVPDSAHGTNPASAALCGFKVRQLKTSEKGIIDAATIEQEMTDDVAGIMMTVPNTLGIFESEISEISRIVHERGGLVYCDGANLNALVGQVDFGAMGADVMHINLHKTFSTPHGGGGPGAGPIVVSSKLEPFLPAPIVAKNSQGEYYFNYSVPKTVGPFRGFFGNFGMLLRALCYIYAYGHEQIKAMSDFAVLNANYLRAALKGDFHLEYDSPSLHEVVFSDRIQDKEFHVSTLDIAKRLIDYGFHPPTIYFPLVVKGALMMEPTESESKRTLDIYIAALKSIVKEAKDNPDLVRSAPHTTGLRRLDETQAARNPILNWTQERKAKEKSKS